MAAPLAFTFSFLTNPFTYKSLLTLHIFAEDYYQKS